MANFSHNGRILYIAFKYLQIHTDKSKYSNTYVFAAKSTLFTPFRFGYHKEWSRGSKFIS